MPIENFPSNEAQKTIIDLRLFTLTAILRTAYWFTAHYYLHLQYSKNSRDELEVFLKAKGNFVSENPAGEFLNNLIDNEIQVGLESGSSEIRKLIIEHAFRDTSVLNTNLDVMPIIEDHE